MEEMTEHRSATGGQAHDHQAQTNNQKKGIANAFMNMNYIKSGIIYAIIALVVFYPLTSNMASMAPGAGGDTYLNLWNIWWVNYATFTLHSSIYFTHLAFWPVGANLVYQTMPPLFAYFSGPFQAISIPFAYDIMFFLGFVVAGLGMYALANYLVNNRYAAFFAGIIYAFSAFHIAQALSHIEWISIGFAPLALFFLLKLLKEEKGRYKSAVGLSLSYLLIFLMAGIESIIMASIFLVLVFIAFIINKSTRNIFRSFAFWKAFVLFIIITAVLGLWLFYPIIHAVTQPGALQSANYLNQPAYNVLWSPDLLSFFLPSYYNGIFNGLATSAYYGIYAADPVERIAYIGWIALIFAVYGIYKNWKSRKSVKLWVALGIIFFLLALGPKIQIGGNVTSVPGLYPLYSALPAINVIREPGRFDLYVTLVTAILAAFGMKSFIGARAGKKDSFFSSARITVAIFALLFLVESAGLPLSAGFASLITTHVSVPSFYQEIGALNGTSNFSVMSLPAFPTASSAPTLYQAQAMYYMIFAHRPLVGGVATRENNTQQYALYNIPLAVQAANLQATGTPTYSSPVTQNLTAQTLFTLYNYNTAFLVLNRNAYNTSTLQSLFSYLQGTFGTPVYLDNTTAAFQTLNAINSSAYRNYVAYPQLTTWQQAKITTNGTSGAIWVPLVRGDILVYAPITNTSVSRSQLGPIPTQVDNTILSFDAIATGSSALLYVQQGTGGQPFTLAVLNVTDKLTPYTVNTELLAGTEPNLIVFAQPQAAISSGGSYAAVSNIQFTKGS